MTGRSQPLSTEACLLMWELRTPVSCRTHTPTNPVYRVLIGRKCWEDVSGVTIASPALRKFYRLLG